MSQIEEAWEGPNRSLSGNQPAPEFAEFDATALPPNVGKKLERIRSVVVKQFGFHDSEVTMKDAAVCRLSPSFLHLTPFIRSFAGHVRWWPGGLLC